MEEKFLLMPGRFCGGEERRKRGGEKGERLLFFVKGSGGGFTHPFEGKGTANLLTTEKKKKRPLY